MQPRLMWDPLGNWAVACLHRRRMVGRLGGGRRCPCKKEVGTVKESKRRIVERVGRWKGCGKQQKFLNYGSNFVLFQSRIKA